MSSYTSDYFLSFGVGDILSDFKPSLGRRLHYLVVDTAVYSFSKDVLYYVLIPLDSNSKEEVKFYEMDLTTRFCTMRKEA